MGCAARCTDRDDACISWARDGNCHTEPEYMRLNCPLSCGICSKSCVDLHDDCPGWANKGQCHENPRVLLTTCPRSCGVCRDVFCKDSNRTLCTMWGDTQCA